MGTGTCWRCGASEDGSLAFCGDPRDAEIARLKVEMVNQRHEIGMLLGEIARLKAEVERLRKSEADLIQWIFDGGQRAGIEPADLSPTEVLTRMSDDLAAHKRALAAGPAALHYRSCDCCSIVEAAQAEAMKEDGDGKE